MTVDAEDEEVSKTPGCGHLFVMETVISQSHPVLRLTGASIRHLISDDYVRSNRLFWKIY